MESNPKDQSNNHISLVSVDGIDPRSPEEIADEMDRLFGAEIAQQKSFQTLNSLMKVTVITEAHLNDPRWLYLKKQYDKEALLDPDMRRVITVINCMMTQNRGVIGIAREPLRRVCTADKTWKEPLRVNNDTYGDAFFSFLLSHPAIDILRRATSKYEMTIIKMKPEAIAMLLKLTPEEVDQQAKEALAFVSKVADKVPGSSTDKAADSISDKPTDTGGRREPVDASSQAEGGRDVPSIPPNPISLDTKEEPTAQIAFTPLAPDEATANETNSIQLWSIHLLGLKRYLDSNGFTKAFTMAFKELLDREALPFISQEDFRKALSAVLEMRFKKLDKVEKYRFDGEYCQEVRDKTLLIFSDWLQNKRASSKTHEDLLRDIEEDERIFGPIRANATTTPILEEAAIRELFGECSTHHEDSFSEIDTRSPRLRVNSSQ